MKRTIERGDDLSETVQILEEEVEQRMYSEPF